jgi:hypothetical protein
VHLDMWGVAKFAVHRDRPRMLNEVKTTITTLRNISQADLQNVFANKIKWVQACIDSRGHHFQHLLYLHSDLSNALYVCVYINVFT